MRHASITSTREDILNLGRALYILLSNPEVVAALGDQKIEIHINGDLGNGKSAIFDELVAMAVTAKELGLDGSRTWSDLDFFLEHLMFVGSRKNESYAARVGGKDRTISLRNEIGLNAPDPWGNSRFVSDNEILICTNTNYGEYAVTRERKADIRIDMRNDLPLKLKQDSMLRAFMDSARGIEEMLCGHTNWARYVEIAVRHPVLQKALSEGIAAEQLSLDGRRPNLLEQSSWPNPAPIARVG